MYAQVKELFDVGTTSCTVYFDAGAYMYFSCSFAFMEFRSYCPFLCSPSFVQVEICNNL